MGPAPPADLVSLFDFQVMQMQVQNVKELSPKQLEDAVLKIGESTYRTGQIGRWLYQKYAGSYDDMTDLSTKLRNELRNVLPINKTLHLIKEQLSLDGTIKYLFRLNDNSRIESVLIPEKKRLTLCISSQVGCALGCKFCLTATVGKIRNLSTAEIIDQVLYVNSARKRPVTNIVFMGMGEPLDNLDNLVRSIELLTDKRCFGMSPKKITVSTSGLAAQIREFGKRVSVNLSISLNASNDETRSEIMPVNRKYPIGKLIASAVKYPLPKRKLLTFEYVLLRGVNDSDLNASELAALLQGLNVKVNLIPYNEAHPLPYKTPDAERVLSFQKILMNANVNAKIRKNRGRDILAACGQLASGYS